MPTLVPLSVLASVGVLTAALTCLLTWWRLLRFHDADGAPLVTRSFRKANNIAAVTFFAVLAAVVCIEYAIPAVHDHVADLQDRIADLTHTHAPRPQDQASFVFWTACYFGLMGGLLIGEWLACRTVGRYFMAALSKVRLIHLISNPWV